MNPRIRGRDIASPLSWGSARPGMAWHHIIPFSLLREVWNRLVDQHIATELGEARMAIRQYLLLADRNQPNLDALIDRTRAENTVQRRAAHHDLHLQGTLGLGSPPGGPARRDSCLYFDRFTSRDTPEGRAGAGSRRAFRLFVMLARPLQCGSWASLDRYRPEMWVEDGDGLWRKRRAAERNTVAGQ